MKNLTIYNTITALFLFTPSLFAQNYTYMYQPQVAADFAGGATALTPSISRWDVRPDLHAQVLFSGMTSTEQFESLFHSGYVLAWDTNLVRGKDVVEDTHYNWISPNYPDRNYYNPWYTDQGDYYVTRAAYPITLSNQGPHAGESLIGNNNLIAFGDDDTLWYDNDGTLSLYNYPGATLAYDYTWTTFSGGDWDGLTLSSQLHLLIGFETSNLYFLDGDSMVYRFNMNGVFEQKREILLSGDLSQYTLGDIIDGKIDGYTYIGWDDLGPVIVGADLNTSYIPEPSSYTVISGLMMLGFIATRRHKK